MAASYVEIKQKIAEIEAEMKRIGVWQEGDLPPEAYNITQAFGMGSMSGEQWLQFILVPRVRAVLAGDGEFPKSSSVGVWAVREFDGLYEADDLVRLLNEFDRLIED